MCTRHEGTDIRRGITCFLTLTKGNETMKVKDLKEECGSGKGMDVHLDNDTTTVYKNGVEVFKGNGYSDMKDLWQALFPDAEVDWV
jgi:hypothetical protein